MLPRVERSFVALRAKPLVADGVLTRCPERVHYHPRNPRTSPLYQCVRRHGNELDTAKLGRPVEAEVLERFLACRDLHKRFARIYCDQCGCDYLLAYSCKTRYFCPSCHQKRMLAYGEWLESNPPAAVPHRQYVFALPKLIRPFFRYRRRYLGALCQLVAALLKAGFKAIAPRGRPAFILYMQTFGDLVTFNPHIHALVADGVFLPSGTFQVLPPLPVRPREDALRRQVQHGHLPLQAARHAETQLPADASTEEAATAHEPHPRQVGHAGNMPALS